MATSDSDVAFAVEQGERFAAVLRALEARGHGFRYVHMENSAAVLHRLGAIGSRLPRVVPKCDEDRPRRLEDERRPQPPLAHGASVAAAQTATASAGSSKGST